IGAIGAINKVVGSAAEHDVTAGLAEEVVIALVAEQDVRATTAKQHVVVAVAANEVVALFAEDRIDACGARIGGVARLAEYRTLRVALAEDDIGICAAID